MATGTVSIGRALRVHAARAPGAPAVLDPGGALSRADLVARSARLAAALVAAGVVHDDIVVVALPSDAGFVVACAAVWTAGATPLPVDPATDARSLAEVVRRAGARLVLDVGALRGWADCTATGENLPDLAASSWKAALSGGSTGPPKIVVSSGAATVDPDHPTATYIPRAAVQLVPVPMHHGAAFLFAMRGLFLGHTLVLLGEFDAAAALTAIARHRVTWAVLTPPLMARIHDLGDAARDADVGSLHSVLHVGAPCPLWLKRWWIEWLGPRRVEEIYAGTESVGVTHIRGEEWLTRPGSVGRASAGSQVRVLDPVGRQVPPGVVGEVFLRPRRGPGSTYRYLDHDRPVRQVDGFESLGDLGHLDGEGYLYLLDRAADVVATAVGDVAPARVETVLDEYPGVRSSAVYGRDGAVHAVVDAAGRDLDVPALRAFAAARLPPHAVPVGIEVTDRPLRNLAGKVRRGGSDAPGGPQPGDPAR